MQILSWNVNGIRAAMRKGFVKFLKKAKPDILCLQEIKIDKESREVFSAKGACLSGRQGPVSGWDFLGYQEFWHSAQRPGYSGTAILVKDGIKVEALSNLVWDNEGRVQVLNFSQFYLVNIYFPNSNHELSRLDFKINFNDKILKYLKKLEKFKPVIVCGDFNVAHQEIDLARPKDNVGNPGFTIEERTWMTKFLDKGFVDTFRSLNKDKVQYSWWSYRFNARERNIGWRIDYFCVSAKIIKNIKKSFILNKTQGSDHCPVGIEVKI